MATKTRSDTRFFTQIALVTLVVVGVVAGVTFVAQYHSTVSPVADIKKDVEQKPGQTDLAFPRVVSEWDPLTSGGFEMHTPGWYDFWFKNVSGKTVVMDEVTKSCRCQAVQVCFFTGDHQDRYLRWSGGSAASEIGILTGGLLPLLAQMEYDRLVAPNTYGAKVDWHAIQNTEDRVKIPPEASGIVRASWDGKKSKIGGERLTVNFWTQAQEASPTPRTQVHLEVNITFIPPLHFEPATVDVGDIRLREEKTAEILVLSATRAGFDMTAREKRNDPCFQCTWRPLTLEERLHYTRELKDMPVRSGYLLKVRIKERDSESQQMDLGPFTRSIGIEADPDIAEQSVAITGTVRGEVVVGGEEDKGSISFKSFRARTGTSKRVLVRAQVPGLTLRQDEVRTEPESLSYLKVRLELAGKNRWWLTVAVPPDSPPGKLPDHGAVLLKIPTSPPRFIRVPVSGIAYQQ
jgi:hypothetical protein